ncbi:hypothetical protein BU16DRAFT_531375 [Lophium mytilinum]|uniref:Uncharacterized protein n=1 Tax=Lophium mytilinum TaxID=390894 RepID=A0A6A6QED4_9PEZI|nr:hypothetical protein BU16DRAFT_531375 [Lophium mytilinum]
MLTSSLLFLFITSASLAEPLSPHPTISKPSLQAPTPSSTINTLASSPTSSLFYMQLPIHPTPPDPLGIAQVSGFYGPGAWAAFIL